MLHSATARLFETLAAEPPQALLFVGPSGVGKRKAVFNWAKQAHNLEAWQVQIVEPNEKGNIPAEAIRELYQFTRVKQDTPRLIAIIDAQGLSEAAQNAFLKLLEEPGSSVYFVLTTNNAQQLLSTIRSRVQELAILPIPIAQHRQIVEQSYTELSATDQAQLLFIAGGLPALADELAADSKKFEVHKERAMDAKTLIGNDTFKKIQLAGTVSDRTEAISRLALAEQMCARLSASARSTQELKKWTAYRAALLNTSERLAANANVKAQLMLLAFDLV